MTRTRSRPVSSPLLALALCLAAAAPTAAVSAPRRDPAAAGPSPVAVTAAQPARVAMARAHLAASRRQLGLGDREDFAVTRAFTNGQGQTIVRLDQTFQGHRVWGSEAIVHVLADGGLRPLTQGLQSVGSLGGAPTLSAAQAVELALQRLDPTGAQAVPAQAELVAFPLEAALAPRLAAESAGGATFQEIRDVLRQLVPGQTHVWAYEVRTGLSSTASGPVELAFIVEGNTGAILQTFDRLERATPPPAFAGPAVGTGHGFYRGAVSLDTTLLADGSYVLWDTTRGTVANPAFTSGFLSWYPDWNLGDTTTKYVYKSPGIAVLAGESTVPAINPYSIQVNPWPFFGATNDAWGDGLAWAGDYANQRTPNGQSMAVDAMSALATSYDFYKNVLGYDGWDGKSGSIYAITGWTDMDNAFWTSFYMGIFLGGGSYPANPDGFLPLTDLDIVAHEYGHAITSPVQFLDAAGHEDGALAEGTSDILAAMEATWAGRAATDPIGAVPGTGTVWEMGTRVGRGTPLRWLDRPSRDGLSADAWYDGVGDLDPHFSMGVINRFFYFLSQGVSATPGDPGASRYLPAGMTGIGNDAALRVWFKTVTERLKRLGSLDDARAASVAAAGDLVTAAAIPAGAVEAVENAWAAVNVGGAHGEPPPLRVSFTGNSPYLNWSGMFKKSQVVPAGEPVFLQAKVENATDPRLDWSIGGPALYAGDYYNLAGGAFDAEGRWTAPLNDLWSSSKHQPHLYRMTATSREDPRQFADGLVFAPYVDTDADGERDALDLAGVAFSWNLGYAVSMTHPVFPAMKYVDDFDVAAIVAAMQSAWPVK